MSYSEQTLYRALHRKFREEQIKQYIQNKIDIEGIIAKDNTL